MQQIKHILFGSIVTLALVITNHVQAVECRSATGVVSSAKSVKANTDLGGHVSIHVAGYPTETNKTRFNSEADFVNAFNNWKNDKSNKLPVPKVCGGANATLMDCVPADRVKISVGNVCTSVDAKGNCSTSKKISPEKVAFRYAKNEKGVWILNTAYPSQNSSCN